MQLQSSSLSRSDAGLLARPVPTLLPTYYACLSFAQDNAVANMFYLALGLNLGAKVCVCMCVPTYAFFHTSCGAVNAIELNSCS